MALLMLPRRFPRVRFLSQDLHKAQCAPRLASASRRAKANNQGLLWTAILLDQKAQGLCESIEMV